MKHILLAVLGASLLLSGCAVSAAETKPAAAATAPVAKQPYRILFIGHSLLAINNVPQAVRILAEAAQADHLMQWSIYYHWGGTHHNYWEEAQALLHQEEWDVVIIAGNLNDLANSGKVDLEYAIKLDNEARKQSARVMEYVAWPWTWGEKEMPGEPAQVLAKRMKEQSAYKQSFLQLAQETGVTLVPCGPGLINLIKKDPKFINELQYGHEKQVVHVSALGSYFTACVIFAEIYNQSPEGLPSVFRCKDYGEYNIDKERAGILQATAWETVQEWHEIQAATREGRGGAPLAPSR